MAATTTTAALSSRPERNGLAVPNMIQPLPKQVGHMIIIEAVEDLPTLFARPHEAHLAQPAHVVGDGRFADPHHVRQSTDV